MLCYAMFRGANLAVSELQAETQEMLQAQLQVKVEAELARADR